MRRLLFAALPLLFLFASCVPEGKGRIIVENGAGSFTRVSDIYVMEASDSSFRRVYSGSLESGSTRAVDLWPGHYKVLVYVELCDRYGHAYSGRSFETRAFRRELCAGDYLRCVFDGFELYFAD